MRNKWLLLLAGTASIGLCGCVETLENISNGQPLIAESAWTLGDGGAMKQNDTAPAGAQKGPMEPLSARYLPSVCKYDEPPDKETIESKANQLGRLTPLLPNDGDKTAKPLDPAEQRILLCMDAMKSLIDMRWREYQIALSHAVTGGEALSDMASAGLSAAGSVTGGATTRLLAAANTALLASKEGIEKDVLYQKTIALIIQQMIKDRQAEATLIQKREAAGAYRDIWEAIDDLQAYADAGTFSHAMASLEADVGSQSNACKKALKKAKLEKSPPKKGAKAAPSNAGTETCPQEDNQPSEPKTYKTKPFAVGQSTPSSGDLKTVEEAAKVFNDGDYEKILIVGKSDSSGDEEKNAGLSLKRASAIKDAMIQFVPASKIKISGAGSKEPEGDKDEDNRVVIITLE